MLKRVWSLPSRWQAAFEEFRRKKVPVCNLYILKPFHRIGCTGRSNAARWISLFERFRMCWMSGILGHIVLGFYG